MRSTWGKSVTRRGRCYRTQVRWYGSDAAGLECVVEVFGSVPANAGGQLDAADPASRDVTEQRARADTETASRFLWR